MNRALKRACWFLSIVVCLVMIGAVEMMAQIQRPYLARISRTGPGTVSLLEERGIPVNAKLEQWYIAQVGNQDMRALQAAGAECQIIDTEAWSQPYFLVCRPRHLALGTMPDVGKVIYQERFEAIVKISADKAMELREAGFRLARLWPEPLPLVDPKPIMAKPASFEAIESDVIGAIMNQVSPSVLESYVRRLEDFRTRYVGTDSLEASAQWIYDRFVEYGYEDVQFEVFQAEGLTLKNVIATKPGVLYPDSVMIIGGHYDSVVYDGTNTRVYAPGADDNASGTVAAMEAARILADVDLDCTVKFAAWSAEEIGLYGSAYYVKKARARRENIGLYINFDMIANLDENDPVRNVNIMRNPGAAQYANLMADLATRHTTLVPGVFTSYGGGSDHYPFQQSGFNIVYGEEGDFSPNWHRHTDTIENMSIPYLTEVVKIGLGLLATAAGPPESFPDPMIAFKESVLDDDNEDGSVGNGNGYYDAGETAEVTLTLENFGDREARGVHGFLMTDDPYVTIIEDSRSFGDIVPEGVGTSAGPFRFTLSQDIPNGHFVNFSLRVTSTSGQEWMAYFSAQVVQPAMTYNAFHFLETVGDGDGILDPGETIELSIDLGNSGLRLAKEISVELSTDDPDIMIHAGEASFPNIPVNGAGKNWDSPFSLSLSTDALVHVVLLTLHISEGKGYYQTDLTFRLRIGQGQVLLVCDDGGVGNTRFYTEVLKHLGFMYNVWSMEGRGRIALDSLDAYSGIIWFTGAMNATLTEDDQNALAAYLDGGGHLLLSGNLIGYDIGNTPFYRDYLHAAFVHFFTRLHNFTSHPANPVSRGMYVHLTNQGENGQSFCGETNPVSPAFSILDYDRTTAEGPGDIRASGSGALAFENERYKLVYCSFGFEGIEPLEDRSALLDRIFAWFQAPVASHGDANGDGLINALDVVLAVRIALGTHVPSAEELARIDFNYDGSIDVIDIMGVVNCILEVAGR